MVKDLLHTLIDNLSQEQHVGRVLRQNVSLQPRSILPQPAIENALELLQLSLLDRSIQHNLINKVKQKFIYLMDASILVDHSFMFYDIKLDSKFQKNSTQPLILDNENMKLYFQGGDIDVNKQALPFITHLLEGNIFMIEDLPGEDIEAKIALAKELLSQHIIKIC